jgi:hypothetical protein
VITCVSQTDAGTSACLSECEADASATGKGDFQTLGFCLQQNSCGTSSPTDAGGGG